MKDFLQSFKFKTLKTMIIIFLLQQINSEVSSCLKNGDFDNDDTCFNNKIALLYCKGCQFAKDKYGNMFILYTLDFSDVEEGSIENNNNRFFYGLKNDGISYFPITPKLEYKINNIGTKDMSRTIFLNLENNNKQYLLSTSLGNPYSSLTELYEIGNNDIL